MPAQENAQSPLRNAAGLLEPARAAAAAEGEGVVDLYEERRGVQADGPPAVPAQAEVVKPLATMGCTSTNKEIGMASAEIEMVNSVDRMR